jgi:hypothetical protein
VNAFVAVTQFHSGLPLPRKLYNIDGYKLCSWSNFPEVYIQINAYIAVIADIAHIAHVANLFSLGNISLIKVPTSDTGRQFEQPGFFYDVKKILDEDYIGAFWGIHRFG